MRKTVDSVRGIVIGTLVMLLLAVPRTIASWSELKSGAYSSLWFRGGSGNLHNQDKWNFRLTSA